MLTDKRPWLMAMLLVVLGAGGYVALDRSGVVDGVDGGSDGPVGITIPEEPTTRGSDEPMTTRVSVENSGTRVSVAVHTGERPWSEKLAVTLNGERIVLRRGEPAPDGSCRPEVRAVRSSLLTRLTYDRACVPDRDDETSARSGTVRASVRVDGGERVRARAALSERPNVVMIMVDDMRTDELRWMPNVRKLIGKQGVTFTNGFSGFPLCCPARASVLSGQLPHNHGVWSHQPPWGFSSFEDASTFPVWLQQSGYTTTYLGKYLNGYGREPRPGNNTGTSTQYVPPGWDRWLGSVDGGMPPGHPDDGGTYRFYDTTLNDNGFGYLPLQGEYQSRAYARLTGETLEELSGQDDPFFSYVSFTAPHHGGPRESDDPEGIVTPARPKSLWGAFDDVITEAPGADWDDPDRSDKPKILRRDLSEATLRKVLAATRQRAEALTVVDESVGRIIGTLRRTGELDDTMVLFTSDNGYFQGEQGRPQGKILPYEPSLRVPVLMRGPGIPRDEVRTDPFLSVDYASTFADLADVDPTTSVDGRSLLDVARLGDESDGDTWSRVVLTETQPTRAVQAATAAVDPVGSQTDDMLLAKISGLRTGRYLYTEHQPEPGDAKPGILVELYDVLEDPEQYDNLAIDPEYADLVDELSGVLAKARTCVGSECTEQLLPANLR
ncbi:sulfatase family protein [Nocardioides donggukensis]|uniref:Sulfatase n=1 Tax=Nocardioides donggukensis TaxID=2774019 RepID=A0A927Q1V9_9ACTN|nr:sulfatase [Nocardioides donggukensis]MBD8869789.1 sulfatase [Nocardioides donggukensis]